VFFRRKKMSSAANPEIAFAVFSGNCVRDKISWHPMKMRTAMAAFRRKRRTP